MKVTLESKGEEQQIGSKGFTKREFIGVDNSHSEYPQPIKFELTKDNCSKLDQFEIGSEVDVEFNIRGNRWTNKEGKEVIFNSFSVWKITASTVPHDHSAASDEAHATANNEPEWLKTSEPPY